MGLIKRRLYKPERRPARLKGDIAKYAPRGCLDATELEVRAALFILAEQAGFIVGRGIGYDPTSDEYHLMSKHLDGSIDHRGVKTGKVKDIRVMGEAVAQVITASRLLAGQRRLGRVARL